MKTILLAGVVVACPLTVVVGAENAASPSTTAASPATSAADEQWAEIEKLLKGPSERPKNLDEAKAIFPKFLEQLDAKSAEFRKAHPNDPRRWKLVLQDIQSNTLRSRLELPVKSEAEVARMAGEIVSAPDADPETKATASFVRVQAAKDPEAFSKLAEAHLKDFPDYRGNRQLQSQIKSKQVEKEIMVKPLDLKFAAIDGREVDLAKMRGKVVLVDFWATWCGPCVAELPNVLAAYKKLHDRGFEIVGISFDQQKDKLETFVKEKEMPWPQFFDGKGWQNEFGTKYGINSIPRMWLVNKKGMVVDTNARADLAGKVEKLLAE